MDKKDESKSGNMRDLVKEISELRQQLNELNEKKEDWFKKKEGLKKYIGSLISHIKSVKSKGDEFSGEYSGLKEQRDKYNQRVKELIIRAKELNQQKADALKKYNIKVDPLRLKEKIKELEYSVETEAYTFKKEKEVMEQIKKLRKKYEESKMINEIVEGSDKISAEIDMARKIANEFHNRLREHSNISKNGYNEFMDISRRINAMKKQQEEAFSNFIKFKVEFDKTNNLLRNKLEMINKAKGELDKRHVKISLRRRDRDMKLLKEKEKAVEEKLRQKKKLTTEDLLVFQGKEDE